MWDWLFEFIEPLEAAKIPYSIVGSVASSVYGEPRATNDLDVVIQLKVEDVPRLIAAFPSEQFYLPPEEVILSELSRTHGAHLNVIGLNSMTKADLYPLPQNQRDWFSRRRQQEVAGRTIWMAAPEVVVLNKLLFYREGGGDRHIRDIRAVLATMGPAFDRAWVQNESDRLGLTKEWGEAIELL